MLKKILIALVLALLIAYGTATDIAAGEQYTYRVVKKSTDGSDRGWIGVYLGERIEKHVDSGGNETIDRHLGDAPCAGGVRIVGVVPEGPAEAAGLQKGDVVCAINGTDLDGAASIGRICGDRQPGDTITLDLWRDGGARTVSLELGRWPEKLPHVPGMEYEEEAHVIAHGDGDVYVYPGGNVNVKKVIKKRLAGPDGEYSFLWQAKGGFLGIQMTELTPELREFYGVPTDQGVLVGKVTEDSPAARAGLRVGDILVEIDGEKIERPGQVQRLIRKRETGEAVSLLVYRKGKTRTLTATIEERDVKQMDFGNYFFLDTDEAGEECDIKILGHPLFNEEMAEKLREMKIEIPEINAEALASATEAYQEALERLKDVDVDRYLKDLKLYETDRKRDEDRIRELEKRLEALGKRLERRLEEMEKRR